MLEAKKCSNLAERGGFEPSRPFISYMLPRSHAHFLLRGRILSIIFIGVWEPCPRHPCSGMAQAIGRFENRPSRPNRGVIAIGRASRSADGYEDLALRLLSAQRFFISSDNRFLPAAVRPRPRRATEPLSSRAAVFRALAGKLRSLSRSMAWFSRSRSCSSSATIFSRSKIVLHGRVLLLS